MDISAPARGYWGRCRSNFDGAPLLWVLLLSRSNAPNRKTGAMVQQYILREDVAPTVAVSGGLDLSVCGGCPRRWSLGGNCYVNVGWAPFQIFGAIKRRSPSYREVKALPIRAPRLLTGMPLRLGAYGDPAVIPYEVWGPVQRWLAPSAVIGFTHQWAHPWARQYRAHCMASVDSAEEMRRAQAEGWRTFRARGDSDPLAPREFSCPASAEEGKRLTCVDCMACYGAPQGREGRASVSIFEHGSRVFGRGGKNYLKALSGRPRQ